MTSGTKIWSTLKRYWREITIAVCVAVAILSFVVSGRRIQEGLDQVNELLDKQRDDLEQQIKTVEQQKTTSIQIIERSERKAETIRNQIDNIKTEPVSNDDAVKFLKDFASKRL